MVGSAHAGSSCAAVHDIDTAADWRGAFQRLFKAELFGDETQNESELLFQWNMSNPFNLKSVGPGVFVRTASHKSRRVFKNNSDEFSQNPLEYVNTFLGRLNYPHSRILRATFKNYETRIQDQIIALIESVEKLISNVADNRQEMGFVATGFPNQGGEILATMRFFNGSPEHSNTPSFLPLEYAFALRKIPLETSKKLAELKAQNPKALIFEIGKFSLEGPPRSRERARALVEMFWLWHYVDPLPEAVFYAHVATRAHLRLYQSRYGFRVAEEISIPGQKEKEYVIVATSAELREALEKIYPIPRLGTVIPQ